MKKYIRRVVDDELDSALGYAGAVVIRGPKACGKTQTALQRAKSVLRVDTDPNVTNLMAIDPKALLDGDTPRLLDEWQVQPKLWDYVRHEVDDRTGKGQFILAGSSTPDESSLTHSGAGRFAVLPMRTLSWQELGYSDGYTSLNNLLGDSTKIDTKEYKIPVQEIIKRLVIGGWPELADVEEASARKINASYIKLLAEVDMSRVTNVRRDPVKVRHLLQSIARNVSTITEVTTFIKDIQAVENEDLSRPTVTDYLDTLDRLMVIEDQPAWNTHIRSSATLRKTPKRHFTDASLAVAALGLDSASLFNDLNYTGFLFESQVIHDLRVYAQTLDAEVYYYRDSSGLEVDAIVQKPNGEAAAFEVKLGEGFVEEAAKNLLSFAGNLDTSKVKITSLNVITGSGYAYTRPDGVNVIPLGALGVRQGEAK
jgi:predicted AAA+ superfamily ATPase